jgi:hypothetical protein
MKFSAVLLLLAAVTVSPDLRYFRYERPILRPPQSSGQGCLTLDPGLFAHAAPQLADLRLYRDAAEIPYVLPLAAPIKVATKPIPPQNLATRNGQIVFDATMPELRYSDIQLGVTGQNFIAMVTVTGSRQPGRSPETNLGAYHHLRSHAPTSWAPAPSSTCPSPTYRYLHFRITGPLTPRSITGVWVMRLPSGQSRYLTVQESSHVVEEEYSTKLVFVVPGPRSCGPHRLQAARAGRRSSAATSPSPSIPSPPRGPPTRPSPRWRQNPTAPLLRVHSIQSGHRIDEERLVFDAPWVDASTPTRWIVSIKNGDDDPLGLDSVRLEMLERKLCFDAQPNAQLYALLRRLRRWPLRATTTPSNSRPSPPQPSSQPAPSNPTLSTNPAPRRVLIR